MKIRVLVFFGFLAGAMAAYAQPDRELLQGVERTYADRLAAYNAVFLQEVTYAAARYRIVKPNAELFDSGEDIWITPFADVKPIRISPIAIKRELDSVYWSGKVQREDSATLPQGIDPFVQRLPLAANSATLSMHRWDLNESGDALLSRLYRFEFSPNWQFDELGNLVFEPDGARVLNEEDFAPPQTPKQLARHRSLLQLQKHVFGSVDADIVSPDNTHYLLIPLKYTPQYSVIIEEDPNLRIPVSMDDIPGMRSTSTLTADEQERVRQYNEFMQGLPKEEDKAVRGDLE